MVLDEADQMLERGFAESVEEVLDEVFHDSKNFIYHTIEHSQLSELVTIFL